METKPKTYNRAKEYCLYLLENSMKTEMEIRRKLKSKDYSEEIINKAIEFLKSYSFIDDKQYAIYYIKEKIEYESQKKIRYELMKRGINKDIIDEKLLSADEKAEYNSAYLCAQKKYKNLTSRNYEKEIIRKKLFDFLFRKGYNYELIKKVINNVSDSK